MSCAYRPCAHCGAALERQPTGQAHTSAAVPDLSELRPEVPPGAVELTRRCLAKRPRDRPKNGEELHRELRAVYGSIRSLDSMLREALAGADVRIDSHGQHHAVVVDLAHGRRQGVHVEACQAPGTGQQLIRIYSVCGPTTERYYRTALELDALLPHGSIGIEPFRDRPHFVMARTFIRASCDPDQIRHSVFDIAKHADAVERRITGRDRH